MPTTATTPAKSNARKYETPRMLRVSYTNEEIMELGKQLAEAYGDSAQVAADLDRVKSDFKAKQSVLDEKIGQLSRGISTGYQMKNVMCKWEMDQPTGGKKTLRRLDSNEVVEVVDMTAADKQVELPLADPDFDAAAAEKDDDDDEEELDDKRAKE